MLKLQLVKSWLVSIMNKVDNFFNKIPCYFGAHDHVRIYPKNYNIYYEDLECNCGIIFKNLNQVKQHLYLGAPKCCFNRVCVRCEKFDNRLDKEVEKLLIQKKDNESALSRTDKALKILQKVHMNNE